MAVPRRGGEISVVSKNDSETIFDDAIETGDEAAEALLADAWSPLTIDQSKQLRRLRLAAKKAADPGRDIVGGPSDAKPKSEGMFVDDTMDADDDADPPPPKHMLHDQVDQSGQASISTAASLLPGEDDIMSDLTSEDLLFFQFPSVMPSVAPPRQDQPADAARRGRQDAVLAPDQQQQQQQQQQLSLMAHAVKGKAGKLIVRRSGRMTLRIGDVNFELNSIPVINFSQNLAHLDPLENSLCMLGDVRNRFVCTPDVESLIA
ncbi:DNA-directed RNA polymerase III subunit RPC4 [Polyrhizophydium stewartii]|uniref:DNA-directed RNA polymerase III subunit RPC4 n=1 Tax=Polyrhizophydium stewartii TaxID=2732419 RepID=A0ABR4NHH8_9FUNG